MRAAPILPASDGAATAAPLQVAVPVRAQPALPVPPNPPGMPPVPPMPGPDMPPPVPPEPGKPTASRVRSASSAGLR